MLAEFRLLSGLSEAVSEPVPGKTGQYVYQGEKGVWRTTRSGHRVFIPDDADASVTGVHPSVSRRIEAGRAVDQFNAA
ncbi:MAG TPA: hypothetical protein VM537_19850, partial [Anaerolineae bacterium]|nr:hypothetical protein [Anaerolineae bacterium]